MPKVFNTIGGVLPDKGALGVIKNLITNDPEIPAEDKLEFEKLLLDYEKEIFALEISDRDSARNREIELAKANRNDHLMYVAGYVALLAFLAIVGTAIYSAINHIDIESAVFHNLMGLVEGVAITVFGYYFGSSKGSRDKNAKLN